MRYVIYGAGAIGGGIGARLAQHQAQHRHEVVLIARGAHLEAMQQDGLRLRAPGEDFRVPVTAVGHPDEIAWRGDEVVLLTMKTQDTAGALEALRGSVGTNVPVICAQNGVENERLAARRFANVYTMLVQMPATYMTPGEVILNGFGVSGVLHAGRYPGGIDETITEVCRGLEASGFSAEPDAQLLRLKYTKLLQNLGNAVQAVCGREDDDVLSRELRRETLDVYAAAGIDHVTAQEFTARTNRLKRGEVEGFDRGGGSTWQSIARGTGSIETDYLNGEVILLGTLHGVPTPVNRALQDTAARVLREGLQPGAMTPDAIMDIARSYGWAG